MTQDKLNVIKLQQYLPNRLIIPSLYAAKSLMASLNRSMKAAFITPFVSSLLFTCGKIRKMISKSYILNDNCLEIKIQWIQILRWIKERRHLFLTECKNLSQRVQLYYIKATREQKSFNIQFKIRNKTFRAQVPFSLLTKFNIK